MAEVEVVADLEDGEIMLEQEPVEAGINSKM